MIREKIDFYDPRSPKGFICLDLEVAIPQLYYVILQTRVRHSGVRANILFDGRTVY
jgi:hypothetical protein